MGDKKIKLAAPWFTYYNEMEALFKGDPDVKLEYDEDTYTIKVFVSNQDKADALTELLPAKKDFGGVVLTINVIPDNTKSDNREILFRRAFKGNPIVKDIVAVDNFGFEAVYVVFSGGIVQFYNDELCDVNGMKTMLLQDVAKDVFGDIGAMLFFCTEKL